MSVRWQHEIEGEPHLMLSELDSLRFEVRKIECYKDGRVGVASLHVMTHGTRLSVTPVPPLSEINADPQFEGETISADDFESQWRKHA